jgi:hypothetical protein
MRTLLLLLALALAPAAHAQFITLDRPGLSLSAQTLPQRSAGVQTGLTYNIRSDGDATTTTFSVPITARFGLTDRVELRVATPIYSGFSVDSGPFEASSDDFDLDFLSIGAKIGLDGGQLPFALSITPEVWLPIDGDLDAAIGATLAAGSQLTSGFTLLGNLGVLGPTENFVDGYATRLSAQGGYPLTPSVFGFVETQFAIGDDRSTSLLGLGAAFSVTPQLMLDVSAYAGLNDTSPDVSLTFGGSFGF